MYSTAVCIYNLNEDAVDMLAIKFACLQTQKQGGGMLHLSPLLLIVHSSLDIFSLTLYYAILCSLHIKIKFIAFICYEICSSYNFLITCL
jgi:hypothetical protein